jgi:hypothetical protein
MRLKKRRPGKKGTGDRGRAKGNREGIKGKRDGD